MVKTFSIPWLLAPSYTTILTLWDLQKISQLSTLGSSDNFSIIFFGIFRQFLNYLLWDLQTISQLSSLGSSDNFSIIFFGIFRQFLNYMFIKVCWYSLTLRNFLTNSQSYRIFNLSYFFLLKKCSSLL